MRHSKRNFAHPFILCVLLLGCAHTREPIDTRWLFVDTKSGGTLVLDRADQSILFAENGFAAEFCDDSGMVQCFVTDFIQFAIPRDAQILDHWAHRGVMYCVIRRDAQENDGDAWLIFSGVGESCESVGEFTQSTVFSRSRGVRFISKTLPNGGVIEIYALNADGFAARWVGY